MAALTMASFVAAWFACGVSAIHADVSERFEVHIRLRVDPSLTSRRITERLKTETEAIWGPYGVRLEWTDDAGAPESAARGLSLAVRLERQFEWRLRMKWPAVLGLVAATPVASPWRSIRVSFDATESVLALRTTGRPAMAGIVLDAELARALGRVLAHEIGHVLLGPDHDSAGLMRASLRANELGEPDRTPFRLTGSGVDRLRGRLRALMGPAPRASARVHNARSRRLSWEDERVAREASKGVVSPAQAPMAHQATNEIGGCDWDNRERCGGRSDPRFARSKEMN
jgi:hypothetical protein